ncbi:MAG: dihydrolipoyllysine-residue acetyltransferase [Pseudomonadota bacterium]
MSTVDEIRVPDIGDFDKVPVIELLVAPGDTIEAEQSLVTLESDKATMEVPASVGGTLIELKVKEGDEVGEGDLIALVQVEAGAEAAESSAPEEPDAVVAEDEAPAESPSGDFPAIDTGRRQPPSSPAAPAAAVETPQTYSGDPAPPPVPFEEMGADPASLPLASPSVRRLARELGVVLDGVQGSGRKGRISEDDLKAHVKGRMSGTVAPAANAVSGSGLDVAALPSVDFSKFGPIEEEPLSRIKRISGPNLHRNWVTIPHVTQFDEADITEMETFRKAAQGEAQNAGTKLTPVVFLIKAVVAGLKAFPHFNASLSSDGQSLIRKQYFHVGVAVDTPNGLVVPVLRDCDQKGLIDLSQELTDLSGRAREGKLKGEEMRGGCFSISSLGGIGGTAFTPIINAPELAILGVSRSVTKPVWDGEAFQPRLMLPLSLSYDHRVIDGADAARFTRYLAAQLEDLRRQLL